MKYKQRMDGEGFVVPSGEVYRIACCDCGLVHDFVFVSETNTPIGVAAKRNNRATAQRRRKLTDWIKVEDRLPKLTRSNNVFRISDEVIAATKEGRVFQTSYSPLGWGNLNSRTDEVTFWRPMLEHPVSVSAKTTETNEQK